MPDIADAVLPAYVGHGRFAQNAGEHVRDLSDGVGTSASDIERASCGVRGFECETARPRHVVYAHEIAALKTVFEDQRRIVVQQTRCEDRQDTGVRIRERLTRAEHVEEPKRDCLDAIRPADHQAHAFLVEFGERID
jgi:hypothetical protein